MNPASSEKQSKSNPATNLPVSHGNTWNRWVTALGLGLLVILPASFVAVDYLVPKAPSRSQGASTRAGWYLRSGQWRADVRTLAAAFEFVMNSVPQAPTGAGAPTNQLATLSRPGGSKLPTMIQVKAGGHPFPKS